MRYNKIPCTTYVRGLDLWLDPVLVLVLVLAEMKDLSSKFLNLNKHILPKTTTLDATLAAAAWSSCAEYEKRICAEVRCF